MTTTSLKLYHGSNMVVAEPRLIGQTRGLDFGPGFYVTTSKKQAARFSEIVVNRWKSGAATVSVYELDMAAAMQTLAIRKFNHVDSEWLEFVTINRKIKTRRKIHGNENVDLVIGAVANDKVMPTLQAYHNDFIDEAAALQRLKTTKLVDQFCFKTEKALSLLRFVRAHETKGF